MKPERKKPAHSKVTRGKAATPKGKVKRKPKAKLAPKAPTKLPSEGDTAATELPSPADAVACPDCDKNVEAGWSHCPFCGHDLGGCSDCGVPMEPSWTFCPQCGHKA